jgi:photosystem II PsbJ protein
MADTNRRVPLWAIATVGGLAVFTLIAVFLYGSYSGLGSSI